jgi:Icc-related predicted phosphoesterase
VAGDGMKTIVWSVDLHLEWADDLALEEFLESISTSRADALLIGGDTAVAGTVESLLLRIADRFQGPVYFVLGNHDFYGGSIAQVRTVARRLTETSRWLRWIPVSGIVSLTPTTCLIGHDGWGDGRLGSGSQSAVLLGDHFLIEDLSGLPRNDLYGKLNALGDECANHLRSLLPVALERSQEVIVLTHVPPFREACLYEGRISSNDYLPHFSCAAAGEVLRAFAVQYPHRQITVLCGHTHNPCDVAIGSNIRVLVGESAHRSARLEIP